MKKVLLLGLFLSIAACSENSEETVKKTEQPQASAEISQGEMIVKQNCKVCHAQGINGAPIIGNKKMWGKRTGKGEAALVENAINGVGLMPAKGGKTHLTKEEITLAVRYFLSEVE